MKRVLTVKSPYPWFGGKSSIMAEVWKRLGETPNFVDPFMGSNAPLLSRAGWDWTAGKWADGKNRIETVNDKDCYVANFWRALNAAPDEVAKWADWPVNEADLHARHLWLVRNDNFIERMRAEPDYYDTQVAGWWVWGLCQWIGGGWCKKMERPYQPRPHLLGAGMGVHKPSKQLPHLLGAGRGVHKASLTDIYRYFDTLAARLRRVRVCCGDWMRVLGPTPTEHNGLTAIILDPPYSAEAARNNKLYAEESLTVAHEVRQWAIANGDNPKLRIALFGYQDEHGQAMPENWECLAWKAHGGYSNRNGNDNDNPHKERAWFSPHCLKVNRIRQKMLWQERGI
jgi:site-specific DNA-adenine methylase